MPQTAVMLAIALWRTAGPVSITRAAIRPAKSFWKNGQLWRTTCRWLCQRTRLVTLATSPALVISVWLAMASGRPASSTAAMAIRSRRWSARNVAGVPLVMARTRWPMNQGTEASSMATHRPATNSAANSGRPWRTKCQ